MGNKKFAIPKITLAAAIILCLSSCSMLPGDPKRTDIGYRKDAIGTIQVAYLNCGIPSIGVKVEDKNGSVLWEAKNYKKISKGKYTYLTLGDPKDWKSVTVNTPVTAWGKSVKVSFLRQNYNNLAGGSIDPEILPKLSGNSYTLMGVGTNIITTEKLESGCGKG